METLSLIAGASLIGVNVHALAALVTGLRARDAAVVSRLSRRCAWSAGGFVLLSAAGLGLALLDDAPHGDDPASRATRLAMVISESMNMAAFAVLGSALPLAAAGILAGYCARLTRA